MDNIEKPTPSVEKQWNTFEKTYLNTINFRLRDMAMLTNDEYLFVSNLMHYLDTEPNDGWVKLPPFWRKSHFFKALARKIHTMKTMSTAGMEKFVARLEDDRGFVELGNFQIRVTEKFRALVEEHGGLYRECEFKPYLDMDDPFAQWD